MNPVSDSLWPQKNKSSFLFHSYNSSLIFNMRVILFIREVVHHKTFLSTRAVHLYSSQFIDRKYREFYKAKRQRNQQILSKNITRRTVVFADTRYISIKRCYSRLSGGRFRGLVGHQLDPTVFLLFASFQRNPFRIWTRAELGKI